MPIARFTRLAAAAACTLAAALPAQAETIYGLTAGANPTLITFDSANPTSLNVVGSVSGILGGLELRSIDFRPADGLLYGLATSGTAAQLYTIDIGNAVASTVGRGFSFAADAGSTVSIDFNPVVDRLRVVSSNGGNYRVNPNTGGLAATDTAVADDVRGIAYTNNVAGATQTTLYGISWSTGYLATIGGVNGVPSPNSGSVALVGDLGFPHGGPAGMDVSGSGMAYLSLDDLSSSSFDTEFYRLNLATGATQFVGELPVAMLDFAVGPVPEPETVAMLLAGLGLLGGVMRRRAR